VVSDRRGQVFTLEAFVAALLVLSSVAFALSVTASTPLSSSTSSQHIESQQAALGGGMLGAGQATDVIRPTLLAWNDTTGRFHGATDRGFYRTCAFGTAFGQLLETSLEDHGMACNVKVSHITQTGDVREDRLVYLGEPSGNAVRVRTSVVLYDDDLLVNEDILVDGTGTASTTRVADAETFYGVDAAPNDRLYNVVVVEVTLWRA
jgi:hypothetical protein